MTAFRPSQEEFDKGKKNLVGGLEHELYFPQ